MFPSPTKFFFKALNKREQRQSNLYHTPYTHSDTQARTRPHTSADASPYTQALPVSHPSARSSRVNGFEHLERPSKSAFDRDDCKVRRNGATDAIAPTAGFRFDLVIFAARMQRKRVPMTDAIVVDTPTIAKAAASRQVWHNRTSYVPRRVASIDRVRRLVRKTDNRASVVETPSHARLYRSDLRAHPCKRRHAAVR